MKRIAVFCGSSPGNDEIFAEKAYLLGQSLAERGIGLVYGGASVGLMGIIADGVLSKKGEVIGVMPHFLKEKEIDHKHLSELILTDSMHERKAKMSELADGFIALPGGFGTLEELFEVLAWAQLNIHKKPVALLNINGFYSDLVGMIETMVDKGLSKPEHRNLLLISDNINELLEKMENYTSPAYDKWIFNHEKT